MTAKKLIISNKIFLLILILQYTHIYSYLNPIPDNETVNTIKILYTAALIDFTFDQRKEEYIKTLEILKSYGYENPYIVEAIKKESPTFLDEYSCHILYSNVNDSNIRNKGVNEAKSILEAFKKFNFQDNDIIIKVTGRYYFTSDEFLKTIEQNPIIDAFVKLDSYGQVFTGCFALRYKYFKEMLTQINYEKMERTMTNIEREVANYINSIKENNKVKIMYFEKLNIVANGLGNVKVYDLQYW